MSKKKKIKSESKNISKPNHQNLKGVSKNEKAKFKHSAKLTKLKNKQNIKDSVLAKSKNISKPNHQNLKGVNKNEKAKFKHSAKLTKLKNKQNIKDSVLAKSKSKQNIKDNIMSKSKNKHKQNIKDVTKPKLENNQNIKEKNAKKDNLLKRLNAHKLNVMLKEKQKEQNLGKSSKKQKKRDTQQSKNFEMTKKDDLLKRLNVNRLNAMLNAKKNEQNIIKTSNKTKKSNTQLSLRERMIAQLKASRFRFLNEQMYNSQSSQSKKYFQDDPDAFYAYHEGYKQQVERWPMNPLDVIVESIKKMPKDHIIADFGCGEAKLAESVTQKVHSFDLVAVNDKVQACDMANTPLLTGRVNVVVFCLSLMGSNLRDYLLEANRVLVNNGILKIAEVESRFEQIEDFIKLMSQYGFVNTWKDLSNNLFYFMDFKKTKDVLKKNANKLPELTLKPCLYKKR